MVQDACRDSTYHRPLYNTAVASIGQVKYRWAVLL